VPHDYPDPKFRAQFPDLRPDFMVVDEREQTPGETGGFPSFPFTAWWRPPYRRTIVIRRQRLPESPAAAAGDAAARPDDTLRCHSLL
jgi:hypothetical protein